MANKPKLNLVIKAFNEVHNSKVNSVSAVGTHIGGKVDHNINNLTPAQGKFENACAIRMSYALNNSSGKIPYMHGKTVSSKKR